MDISNYENVVQLAKNEDQKKKVKLILKSLPQSNYVSVPDPYWDDNGFEQVFQMLDKACNSIIAKELALSKNKK